MERVSGCLLTFLKIIKTNRQFSYKKILYIRVRDIKFKGRQKHINFRPDRPKNELNLNFIHILSLLISSCLFNACNDL